MTQASVQSVEDEDELSNTFIVDIVRKLLRGTCALEKHMAKEGRTSTSPQFLFKYLYLASVQNNDSQKCIILSAVEEEIIF